MIDSNDLCAFDSYNDCNTRCSTRITSRGYNFIDSAPSPYKLDVMKSCLYDNRVFIASIPVFRNWNDMLENKDPTDDVPDPEYPGDPNYIASGHALCFVGYVDNPNWAGGGYFWFKNSWSEFWGNNGYGTVSYEFMRLHAREIAVVDESEIIWSEWVDGSQCVETSLP